MRGLPGSGKSTKSFHLFDEIKDAGGDPVICSSDHFFTDANGNYNYDKTKLTEAHTACMFSFLEALQAGKSIIVDNTNIKLYEFVGYIIAGQARNYSIRIVQCTAPPEECFKRGIHNVPLSTIQQMDITWEFVLPWHKEFTEECKTGMLDALFI